MPPPLAPPDFRALFESSPGRVLVLLPDAPRFTIVGATDAYLKTTRTRREEIVGRGLLEVLPVPALQASLERVLKTRVKEAMALERQDGQRSPEAPSWVERWWQPVNRPVLGAEGQLCYLLHQVEDVTEQVLWQRAQKRLSDALGVRAERAEADIFRRAQELNEVNRQLRGANVEVARLFELTHHQEELQGQFFANVGRELKTPLCLILGPIERMLQSTELPEELRRDLELVRRNAAVLDRQVDDLLDLARLDAGRLELEYADTDLAALVRWVVGQFEGLARDREIHLGVRTPDSLLAQVDPAKLQRVLSNLLSNACKFTPAHGCIGVTLREEEKERVYLEVADSGPGIPEDQREAIFERFRQMDPEASERFGGMGLGLAIAREFVRLHGGSIRVTGTPRVGTFFQVELPRRAPVSVRVGPAVPPSDSDSASGPARLQEREVGLLRPGQGAPPSAPLVLVAEDNPELSRFIRESLADGFRTEAAFEGGQALERVRELKPDVVLVDILMPGLNGEELVAAIRSSPELQRTAIVVLTAKSDDELRVRLLRAGAQDYITKPFLLAELRARLDNLVSRRRAEEGLREAQRLREEWISVIAHDLRQPVSVIALSVQSLSRLVKDGPPKVTRVVERIARGACALDRMVNDLLDVSRIEARRLTLDKRPVDLGALVREVVERTPEVARRCNPPEPGEPVVVRADAVRIEQVLENLLSNAVRYGDPGAGIDVKLESTPEEAHLSVTNRGKGIRPEELSHLFERFQRSREARQQVPEGVGVGLYIAKGLVEAHGGRMWAESTPGETTCFHFTLPTGRAETTEAEGEAEERQAPVFH